MMNARIMGVSVIGPGLEDWRQARAVLGGRAEWVPAPTTLTVPTILGARERRRASPAVRLALNTAQAACADADIAPDAIAGVFTSAIGNGMVVDRILRTLATEEKLVSPTLFHNSVHNAAAGYWNIATGSRAPSTSLCAGDQSFGAGLLKALIQVSVENRPVLLVVFDCPLPPPLGTNRPLGEPMGVGLLLAPPHDDRGALIQAEIEPGVRIDAPKETLGEQPLMALRNDTPAGRALPLLQLLARDTAGTVVLETSPDVALRLAMTP